VGQDPASWRRTAVLCGLLAALLAAGCGRGGPARPRSTASIAIVHPAAGSVVEGPRVRVEIALTGGRIVVSPSAVLAPDEGHIHLTLDGRLVSMDPTLVQHLETSPGPHVLEAEFAANDHLSFEPRVIAAVAFTVR
jgi:hypothetical protein